MSDYVYDTLEEALIFFPHYISAYKTSIKEGENINNIKIISRTNNNKHGSAMFICQCPYCNKFFLAKGKNIKAGITKSCGCYNRQTASVRMKKYNEEQNSFIQGERFGKLEVIEDLGLRQQQSRNKNERWVKCKCDCGKYKECRLNDLKQGLIHSCGCLGSSYAEFIIEQILTENNISFKREIKFKDLLSSKNAPLRFDFGVYDQQDALLYLIEFDGRQHFSGPEAKWNQEGNTLEEIQQRDKLKNEYCQKNKIPLIRIPSQHLKGISLKDLKLETTDFIYYNSENKECKMNNRFLSIKKDCKECEYNHICKEKEE